MTRLYPHAQAILGLLEASTLRVGDHKAPKSTDGKIVAPCAVLYMTPSMVTGASLDGAEDDALIRFRVIAVGLTPGEAEDVADDVFDALDGATVTVSGRSVFRLRRSAIAGVERDEDVTPPCFYASTPYQMMSMKES